MKNFTLCSLLTCSFFLFSITVKAQFSGGTGTESDPYQITTIVELDSVHSYLDKHYVLMNNLDFDGSAYCSDSSTAGWEPLGNSSTKFTGSFNGQGYVIKNLYINRSSTDYIGLFGFTNGATMDSLGIINAILYGANKVGILAGYTNASSFQSCFVSGDITSTSRTGGMIGLGYSCDISQCYASINIQASDINIGGLLGTSRNSSTISNCYATGTVVSGSYAIGGLVGCNFNSSTINSCYASCYVSGSSQVGAFVGDNQTTVNTCYYNSDLSTLNGIGDNTGTGTVTGLSTDLMKIADNFDWDIANSNIWGIDEEKSYPALKGVSNNLPFVNSETYVVEKSTTYTLTTDSLLANDYDYETGKGSLTVKIISATSNYLSVNAGVFTFYSDVAGGSDTIVYKVGEVVSVGDTLWSNPTSSIINVFPYEYGTGTENDPYQIYTIEDLNNMRTLLDKHFILMNNLDFNGSTYDNTSAKGWEPIGNSDEPFTGSFKGKGYIINNLYINRSSSDYIGLFGYTSGASIDSLGLINCNITGAAKTGTLAGSADNASTISQCFATGELSGTQWVGGFIGYTNNASIVSQCYSTIDVTTTSYPAGGFIGRNDGGSIIKNSYSLGDLSTTAYQKAGGFVGYNYKSEIDSCYCSGNVTTGSSNGAFIGNNGSSTLTSCYYNSEACDVSTAIGASANNQTVNALTNEQMLAADNFNLGIAGNTIWGIVEGHTYPALNSVNNAPFAIDDTFRLDSLTYFSDSILINDYDYENGQSNLFVNIIEKELIGTDTLVYKYQTGELLSSGDTLWGCSATATAIVQLFDGSGTSEDPYVIATLEDLRTLSEYNNFWGMSFIQTADIDASDTKNWNDGDGYSPLGNWDGSVNANFSGYYNGGGHAISNLYINSSLTGTGFIGYTQNNAKIDSLNLINCDITGTVSVGGIVGYGDSCNVSHCSVSGIIKGGSKIGGLVGWAVSIGTIDNCHSTASVTANAADTKWVGGLVGQVLGDININNCYASGSITGSERVGGLVGASTLNANTSNCHASGTVTGTKYTGGFVGYCGADTITNCYSSTLVMGEEYSGGFCGFTYSGEINNCYTIGNAIGTSKTSAFGEVHSTSPSVISNCYYNSDISDSTDNYCTGLPTDSMLMVASFSNWSISNSTSDSTWGIIEGYSYPALNGVNNAPFAFTDSIMLLKTSIVAIDTLLTNDYDYETGTNNLCYTIDSIKNSSFDATYIYFTKDDTSSVYYRVGEVLSSGDTLWGNNIESYLIYINVVPEITSIAPGTAVVGSEYTYTVVATDTNGDELSYSLSNQPDGMTISDSVITWTPGEGITSSGEVTLTVSDGELSDTEKFTITVSSSTGIEETNDEVITLYPNPATDNVTIKGIDKGKLIVMDCSGNQVFSDKISSSNYTLDVSNYLPGFYIITVSNTNQTYTVKLVVK